MVRRVVSGTAVVFFLGGCVTIDDRIAGTGPVVSEHRVVGTFDRIDVGGHPHVRVVVGPPASVTVSAQRNVADLIETTTSNGTLTIEDRKDYRSDRDVLVAVTTPALQGFSIRGASAASIAGVRGSRLDLAVSGAGDLSASGSVGRLSLDCSGVGNANLRGLQAGDAVVHLSGVGNAHISVSKSLDASIAGVGSIHYHGSPNILHRSIAGLGTITQD